MGSPTDLCYYRHPVGAVTLTGADRVDLLHRISTRDLRELSEPGRLTSTIFTTNQGRVIDWCRLLSEEERLLAVTSSGRGPRVQQWIDEFTITEDVESRDLGGELEGLVLLGPDPGIPVPSPGEFRREGELRIAQELPAYVNAFGGAVWVLGPGAALDGFARDLEARGARPLEQPDWERRRLLAGVPSPAFEFEDEVNPLELRLRDEVSFDKGCYIGQEVIARMDSYDKVARLLMGVEIEGAIPGDWREARLTYDGRGVGRLTSLALTEAGGSLGLAVVTRDRACPGEVELRTSEGSVAARLVDRPFWA